MWEFQDRPLDMSTPKYLALVTTSRTWPCNLYGKCTDFLEVVILTSWYFEGLNSMSHLDFHTISLSKSSCKALLSSVPPTVRHTAVSSAKRCTLEVSSSDRSLMYMRNRILWDRALWDAWCHWDRLIPHHQGLQSATCYSERHGSSVMNCLWPRTGGASRGAWSDLPCQRPLKCPAALGQSVSKH